MTAPTFAELAPLTREKLVAGIALFNGGAWWHAHEAWEDAWNEEDGTTRLWLQALIQLAAAYHKGIEQRQPRGMAMLFEKSLEKLERVRSEGDPFGGVALAPLCEAARRGRAIARLWECGDRREFERDAIATVSAPV